MLTTMWQITVRRALRRRLGIDILNVRPEIADILLHQQIDLVLDVGANEGQYASMLRAWGYRGRIVSFEPLSAPFRILNARAERDPLWDVVNIGLGDRDTTATINVAANSVYSSILPATAALHAYDDQAAAVSTEVVTVRRLDSVLAEVQRDSRRLYLKVDTQGYERNVIEGAGPLLETFQAVQLELSENPMYEGEPTFLEMTTWLASRGFRIGLLRPFAFDHWTKLLVQTDVVFVGGSRAPGSRER